MTLEPEPTHHSPRREHRRVPDPHSAPDRGSVSDRGPTWELTRREFAAGIAKATLVGAIAPFSFVRAAPARADELDRYLRRKLVEANTPGIAVAVVREGAIAWSAGVGWADREQADPRDERTVFQLASVSKTLTCAGIMALVEDGVIDLDADVNGTCRSRSISPTPRRPDHDAEPADSHVGDPRSLAGMGHVRGPSPRCTSTATRRSRSATSAAPTSSAVATGTGAGKNFYDRAPGIEVRVLEPGGRARGLRGRGGERRRLRRARASDRVLAPLGMTDTGFRLADIDTLEHRDAVPACEATSFEPIFHYGYPDYPDGALRTSAVAPGAGGSARS